MKVEVEALGVVIDDRSIVSDVDLRVANRTVHGVIGPNGSGKSTVLRCIYRALRPTNGAVLIGGDDVWRELSAREAARRRAIVAQDSALDFDFTVQDVVAMGRTPHKRMLDRDDLHDQQIVERALDAVEMGWARHRLVATLSGGERQRVFVARAVAQEAPVLVLDEPTNHLDVRAQHDLLRLVRGLGLTTIAALHDLDHAASVCDAVSVLRDGRVVASGPPSDVLTPKTIMQVFGVRAHIGPHPITGRPHIALAALDPDTETP